MQASRRLRPCIDIVILKQVLNVCRKIEQPFYFTYFTSSKNFPIYVCYVCKRNDNYLSFSSLKRNVTGCNFVDQTKFRHEV